MIFHVDKSVENDIVDPNLFADRIIVNTVNTQLGITMTTKDISVQSGVP